MTKASERRDGPRIDLRLRAQYSAPGAEGVAEASDVSPRGLRLESENPVDSGSELNLKMDTGDEEEQIEATGHVTWCRPRKSPTGRQLYDIGVHFSTEWLAQDRGPLGNALARIFAMNQYEPARNFERTKVSLDASTSSSIALEVSDISLGGTQLRADKGQLDGLVSNGTVVIVELEADGDVHSIDGKVVWVDSHAELKESFGVQFDEVAESEQDFLEGVRKGDVTPARITVFLQK